MRNIEARGDVALEQAAEAAAPAVPAGRWRVLFAGCFAHVVHDGLTDMLYVFFPVWQQVFGLSFAEVGVLKACFSGSMALFQVPAGILAGVFGSMAVLTAGTVLSGLAQTPLVLGCLLLLGGLGSSTQHPLASSAISSAYSGKSSRIALSTYNFLGDVGKLIIPATASLAIAWVGWQHAISTLGLCGLAAALVICAALWSAPLGAGERRRKAGGKTGEGGGLLHLDHPLPFLSLAAIGVVDSATRMGFLTFLPFLLRDKGADLPAVGLALSLVFAGGATGKLVCGATAARIGILRSVVLTELSTAACIWAIVGLDLTPALALCPVLGVALNGTSSVLYGTVPDLVTEDQRKSAFALFYTGNIGAGAVSPFLFGLVSDGLGLHAAIGAVAALVLVTLPLTLPLRGKLTG
jgi:predicted MFS family arabinose efflux permease